MMNRLKTKHLIQYSFEPSNTGRWRIGKVKLEILEEGGILYVTNSSKLLELR